MLSSTDVAYNMGPLGQLSKKTFIAIHFLRAAVKSRGRFFCEIWIGAFSVGRREARGCDVRSEGERQTHCLIALRGGNTCLNTSLPHSFRDLCMHQTAP